MATKSNSKCCQTSEIELIIELKLLPATETNSESCQISMMALICFYRLVTNLTNVMKVFVFFTTFIDIFTNCNVR